MEVSDSGRPRRLQFQDNSRRPLFVSTDWLGRIGETTTDMKLDRNVNKDGRGKYALINLRTNKVEWGGEGGQQFFVLKYKDKFAAPALRAYARACLDEARRLEHGTPAEQNTAGELIEFAGEVEREAVEAEMSGECVPS